MTLKKCKVCGKEFQAHKHTQRCCSPECSKANGRRISANWHELKKGRAPIVKKCKVCGEEFQPHKHNQLCCSRECSMKNKKQRNTYCDEVYYRRLVARRAAEKKAERDKRLARLDLEHTALHVPVKVTERDGVRTESRGLCPGGWQGRGKLITHP